MTRAQLEHLIRAAADLADDTDIVVIGSQAVLGQFPDAPASMRVSAEADLYPLQRRSKLLARLSERHIRKSGRRTNEAQVNEKDEFQKLLFELCRDIKTPPQVGRGQRRLPLSDMMFSSTFKVYSTFSGRRFMSDLREAHERKYIARVPHFNSIFNCFDNPDAREILTGMIELTALPLKAVQETFAVDSSSFGVSRFFRRYDHKYGVEKDRRDWVKIHVMVGTRTNIVTAVEIKRA